MVESAAAARVDRPGTQAPIPVVQILAGINDKYGLLTDGRFEQECIEILELIDETRVAQGYIPYDDNQRIIVVRELYRVMEKFRGKKRRSGGSYFFDHLLGAVKILVKDIGLNGPASIIAEANHDSLEDLIDEDAIKAAVEAALAGRRAEVGRELIDPEIENIQRVTRRKALAEQRNALKEDLVDTSGYAHLIKGFDRDAAIEIARSVQEMCIGVTKERLSTVEATRDATLQHLLAVVMRNVKSVFIKFPDRAHNLQTLGGHLYSKDGEPLEGAELKEAEAKQRKIVEETELIYLPLARRTRVRNMVRFFVDQCMNSENPELAASFSALSSQRLSRRVDPFEGEIRAEFATNFLVHNIEFVPRGLDFYTARSDQRFKDLTLNGLNISRRDPMFDIVITTIGKDVDSDSEKAMEAVLTHVQTYFGAGSGTKVEIERPQKGDLTGIKVHVFNPRFGGHLSIRINDCYVERKLDRGILANFQEKTPGELKDLIGPILDISSEPEMGGGTVDRSKRGLLRNDMGVFDNNERLRFFPPGATVLDFANAIHWDVLWGAQAAFVEDAGIPEGTEAVPVSLIDPLERGKVYFVDSCIAKGRRDRSKVKMHPGLLYFCQAPARKHIRPLLKDPWVSLMEGLTLEEEDFIAELNRKRQESIAVCGEAEVRERIHSLRERKEVGSLTDEQIIEILKLQDERIDATGVEYLGFLSDLFGVNERLIRSLLAPGLSLRPTRRNSSGRLNRRDQMRKRAIINRAVAIGDQKANPLFVLATYFEKVAAKKRPLFEAVKDGLWEVQIVVPDRAGELSDFGKEFSRQVGVNLYDFRSRKRPNSHEDVMIFRIDLDSQGIPIYDFLVKLLKLRIKYPTTRLTQNPFMDVVENGSVKPRGPVADESAVGRQLELPHV